MNFNKLVLASISFVTGMLMLVFPLQAKVEGDKICLLYTSDAADE